MLTSVLIIGTGSGISQNIPVALSRKIDSLFLIWNTTSSPGCSVGIVRNDSLIYAKGYGMSNLEYGIINEPRTIYHMASVSKQFTAYAILLLEKSGKLSIDDDVHKYLNWFPDMHKRITIRNLLNHTSGIRDQWELLAIAGTRLDDVITQEQIVKLLSRQQALNFEPGSKYAYSNSGFTMLAEIVKAVSGQTLRQFTDSAIFKPLGMTSTHFHDDYTEIEKNRAYSYDTDDSGRLVNSILSYSNEGATSLFTNVPDMSKWVMNFYQTRVGDASTITELAEKTRLTSGKEISYAKGIVVNDFRGQRQFGHDGADAGYRTSISVYPDLKLGFIVFSNFGDFDPSGKAREMASLFIPEPAAKKKQEAAKKVDSTTAVISDTNAIHFLLGSYSGEDAHFGLRLRDQRLYWVLGNGKERLLIPSMRDSFADAILPEVKFLFSHEGGKTIMHEFWPDNSRVLTKYDERKLTDEELGAFTGVFYCPELDCKYGVALKNHQLVLTNDKYDDKPLTVRGDFLTDDYWWIQNIKMLRSSSGKITGFETNSGRVQHLFFEKLK